jgi:hypothetical protein
MVRSKQKRSSTGLRVNLWRSAALSRRAPAIADKSLTQTHKQEFQKIADPIQDAHSKNAA